MFYCSFYLTLIPLFNNPHLNSLYSWSGRWQFLFLNPTTYLPILLLLFPKSIGLCGPSCGFLPSLTLSVIESSLEVLLSGSLWCLFLSKCMLGLDLGFAQIRFHVFLRDLFGFWFRGCWFLLWFDFYLYFMFCLILLQSWIGWLFFQCFFCLKLWFLISRHIPNMLCIGIPSQ